MLFRSFYGNQAGTALLQAGIASPQYCSIYSQYYVASSFGFIASSDARIKNINGLSSNNLSIINSLQVKSYSLREDASNTPRIGFIAQDVQDVFSQVVGKSKQVVPNIMKMTDKIEANVVTLSNHGLNTGILIRFVKESGSFIETKITSIIDNNSFEIEENITDDKIFIYGTEVDDFLSIDYNQIFSVAVGAIQELSAENTALKSRLDSLEQSLTTAAANYSSLEARLAAAGL